MGPDEEKRLRELLRKSHQLPEPNWNLLKKATRRFSRAIKISEKPLTQIDGKITKRDQK